MTKKIETLEDAAEIVNSLSDFATQTVKNRKEITDLLLKAVQNLKDKPQNK